MHVLEFLSKLLNYAQFCKDMLIVLKFSTLCMTSKGHLPLSGNLLKMGGDTGKGPCRNFPCGIIARKLHNSESIRETILQNNSKFDAKEMKTHLKHI